MIAYIYLCASSSSGLLQIWPAFSRRDVHSCSADPVLHVRIFLDHQIWYDSEVNKALTSPRIKRSTLVRLTLLARSEYRLSDVMRESLSRDPLTPVLTEDHLQALDRRLAQVLRAVGACVKKLGQTRVLITDFQESSRVTPSHPGGRVRWQNQGSGDISIHGVTG